MGVFLLVFSLYVVKTGEASGITIFNAGLGGFLLATAFWTAVLDTMTEVVHSAMDDVKRALDEARAWVKQD
jgi:hypothetical protein